MIGGKWVECGVVSRLARRRTESLDDRSDRRVPGVDGNVEDLTTHSILVVRRQEERVKWE